MDDKRIYVVRGNTRQNHDTVTLSLSFPDDRIPTYIPGQFITIYFPELGTPEGKAYSISSAPHEKRLNITIKAIGEFSNRLCAMQPGSRVLASLPYGFFCSENEDTDLVMIAAGIGITPFRSLITHACLYTPNRKLSLFYSVRTRNDCIFMDELPLRVPTHQFVTREATTNISATLRRMDARDILGVKAPDGAEFFICGSISFVRDLWRGLKGAGVPEDRIYTEAFFSH